MVTPSLSGCFADTFRTRVIGSGVCFGAGDGRGSPIGEVSQVADILGDHIRASPSSKPLEMTPSTSASLVSAMSFERFSPWV